MTKVESVALAEHWQAKADRASDRYQESGLPRHNREREQAQDLADALQIAVSAADDHSELISLRGAVCRLAVKAHAAVDALAAHDRASDQVMYPGEHLGDYAPRGRTKSAKELELERQLEETDADDLPF